MPDATIDSNLQDAAIFLEHRLQFSPQWSVLYGLRGDLVQLNDTDPLYTQVLGRTPTRARILQRYYGPPDPSTPPGMACTTATSAWCTARPTWISGYLTFNKAQYVDAKANDGAVGTLGLDPTTQLRQETLLEEAGSSSTCSARRCSSPSQDSSRSVPYPPARAAWCSPRAHITGAEIELNYQPNSHFFATASYSYLHTTLDTPAGFWNFPAQPGINIDGAGGSIVYEPDQNFQDPGVPEHLFNVLVNYKLDNGLGFQANVQVTGPIQTTQAGAVDIAATEANLINNFGPTSFIGYSSATALAALPASIAATGYYRPPTIPWQYTINAGVFYSFLDHYTVKFEIYNLTNERNLQNDYSFYGNDFLTLIPPRSYDLTFTAKL